MFLEPVDNPIGNYLVCARLWFRDSLTGADIDVPERYRLVAAYDQPTRKSSTPPRYSKTLKELLLHCH